VHWFSFLKLDHTLSPFALVGGRGRLVIAKPSDENGQEHIRLIYEHQEIDKGMLGGTGVLVENGVNATKTKVVVRHTR
jgi:hypothetical protein